MNQEKPCPIRCRDYDYTGMCSHQNMTNNVNVNNMSQKRTVQFKAVKTIQVPTVVKFKTKSGDVVSFKAVKGVEKKVDVRSSMKKTV